MEEAGNDPPSSHPGTTSRGHEPSSASRRDYHPLRTCMGMTRTIQMQIYNVGSASRNTSGDALMVEARRPCVHAVWPQLCAISELPSRARLVEDSMAVSI